MEWFTENLDVFIPVIVLLVDFIAGAIPDKYLKYVGVIRRIANKVMDARRVK